jgi:Tfp pilus assembly protein PilO
MTLTRNHKIILAVAIAAALLGGFWFQVLAPKRAEATKLDTQIAAKQSQAAQAQTQLATYEKARASYKANYAKLVSLGKAAPADDDVRSLMVQLDQQAGRGNVTFDKVEVGSSSGTPTPPTTPTTTGATAAKTSALAAAPGLVPLGTTGVSALPFSLAFDGSFMNLSGYFHQLQRFVRLRNEQVNANGRLLRIESIDIAPSAGGWPSMNAQVGAASYVVDPLPALGSQTASPATGTTPSTPTSPPTGTSTTPATTTATVPGVAR